MPLISIVKLITGLLSWVILAAAIWIVWDWYSDNAYVTEDGHPHVVLANWPLWLGLGLLLLSFGGRWFWLAILARGDDAPISSSHGVGTYLHGVDGSTLYVETLGKTSGPTIVFTHGWGLDSTSWFYAKRDLSSRFRLVVWDLPGLGKSSAGTQISLESFADDLRTVIEFAGTPVVLVGHSIGGMTIQTLALRHPELFLSVVRGVVLLNTTYTNPLKTMILSRLALALRPVIELAFRLQIWLQPLAWMSSWQSYLSGSAHLANRITFGPNVTRSQLEHVTLLGTRNPPAVLAKGNLAMFAWDATNALAGKPVPVLVVGGDIDIVTLPSAGVAISATTENPRYLPITAANHMSVLDQAAVYDRAIQDFAAQALEKVPAE